MNHPLAILAQSDWQMTAGERVALEGMLAQLKPAVSVELGAHLGGSLGRIATHSKTVHSFDLTLQVSQADYPNVQFHIGDCHELLPALLRDLTSAGQTVSFSLIDGDHSPAGVRQDLQHLLESPAVGTGIILLHDVTNEAVRAGIESVPWTQFSKVAEVNLDLIVGVLPTGPLSEGWAGFGLIVLDAERTGPGASPTRPEARRELADVARIVRAAKRNARRATGKALRRANLHPSQH